MHKPKSDFKRFVPIFIAALIGPVLVVWLVWLIRAVVAFYSGE